MRQVLRSQLTADVRFRGNFENAGDITDAQIQRLCDQGAAALYDLVLEWQGQEHFATTFAFNTVAQQSLYILPADFYQLLAVRIQIDGFWRSQEPINRVDADIYLNTSTLAYPYVPGYRLQGLQSGVGQVPVDQIEMLPVPQGVYPVQLEYVPNVSTFVSLGDVAYFFDNGWEEWVTADVVAKLLAREESDPSFWLGERANAEARIRALAGSRDRSRPERIIDVQRNLDTDPWGPPTGGFFVP